MESEHDKPPADKPNAAPLKKELADLVKSRAWFIGFAAVFLIALAVVAGELLKRATLSPEAALDQCVIRVLVKSEDGTEWLRFVPLDASESAAEFGAGTEILKLEVAGCRGG